MKNKIIKITYIFIIFGTVSFNIILSYFVYAITETDLENQISDIETQINQTNTEIARCREWDDRCIRTD